LIVRRSLASAPVLGALCLIAAGCGNERTPVPSVTAPAVARAFHTVSYAHAGGVTLSVPESWTSRRVKAPLIGTVSSGSAMIALWRYPRTAALPSDHAALESALKALVTAARTRDPHLQLIRSAITKADGKPAVEVDVVEHIGTEVRRVRSVHVYAAGAEVVLEEYSPPSMFHSVDHTVFSPVRRSLRLVSSPAA
jgi:hypothetical protein